MNVSIPASSAIPRAASPSRRVAAGAAALLGFAFFFTAGFASPSMLHNATHDMRHSLGLPCH